MSILNCYQYFLNIKIELCSVYLFNHIIKQSFILIITSNFIKYNNYKRF